MKKRLCDSCIHSECSKSDNPISTVVSCGVTVDCLDYKSVDSSKEVNCEDCIYYNMGDGCEYSYCKKELKILNINKNAIEVIPENQRCFGIELMLKTINKRIIQLELYN